MDRRGEENFEDVWSKIIKRFPHELHEFPRIGWMHGCMDAWWDGALWTNSKRLECAFFRKVRKGTTAPG
jgi:hypothetical protein